MQKNFASELIAKAIEREEDAHRLYSQAANLAQKPEVKKLFEELASQELDQKETLKNLDDGVPIDVPMRVSVFSGDVARAELIAFAIPKSVTSAAPPDSMTLAGLMSRWTTPRPCA